MDNLSMQFFRARVADSAKCRVAMSACRLVGMEQIAPFRQEQRHSAAPPNGAFIFNVYHGQGAIPAKNCGDSTLAGPDSAALLTGPAMPPHPVLLRGYLGGVPSK